MNLVSDTKMKKGPAVKPLVRIQPPASLAGNIIYTAISVPSLK